MSYWYTDLQRGTCNRPRNLTFNTESRTRSINSIPKSCGTTACKLLPELKPGHI